MPSQASRIISKAAMADAIGSGRRPGKGAGEGQVELSLVDAERFAERVIELAEGVIGLAGRSSRAECNRLGVMAGGFQCADLGVQRHVCSPISQGIHGGVLLPGKRDVPQLVAQKAPKRRLRAGRAACDKRVGDGDIGKLGGFGMETTDRTPPPPRGADRAGTGFRPRLRRRRRI